MANLLPDPHVLQSMTRQDLPWWKCLAELVDNAFDASASRVVIECSRGTLCVRDDGKGVKNLLDLARLGKHTPSDSTSLGMHGIGAKDAWLSCSDVMEIESVHAGKIGRFKVDQRELLANGWDCEDPSYEAWDGPSYTDIKFKLRPGKVGPQRSAYETLAFVFTPAIQRGLQIAVSSLKGAEALKPLQMPLLQEPVRSEFEVDGNQVSIDIGILPAGQRMEKGPFWLIYDHRIIAASSIGAGEYSVRRVGGTIKLGKGWKLSKNKDSITENLERLDNAIYAKIKPLMAKAHAIAESIENDAIKLEIEKALDEAVAGVNGSNGTAKGREGRNKGDSSGSILPRSTGRKRKNAAIVHPLPGSIDDIGNKGNSAGRNGKFVLDYDEMDDELGKFERLGMRVTLNLLHPFVKESISQDNRQSLLLCAFSLIADYSVRHEGEAKVMRFHYGDFASAMGALTKTLKPKENTNAKPRN